MPVFPIVGTARLSPPCNINYNYAQQMKFKIKYKWINMIKKPDLHLYP